MRKILIASMLLLTACVPDKPATECMVGGCSGQLCIPKGEEMASTCEWREEYACYKQVGECKPQGDGTCGWTQTPELKDCLQHPSAYVNPTTQQKPNDTSTHDNAH